ncbi:MAG: metal ABC transporter permease [Planctomycetota bacterium]
MISDFLSSWDLFHNTYLTAWSLAVLLSLAGVWVVARNQIFLGAAVSQASLLGVATSLFLGSLGFLGGAGWESHETAHAFVGGAFAVVAALVAARPGGSGSDSREAMTGWIFLLGSSGAVLLLSHHPHGLEEVNQLTASSILGATPVELACIVTLLVATLVVMSRGVGPLILLATDPEMAAAVGLRVRGASISLCVWLGLTIGLSLHAAGLAYTFGCLVLPPLAAKHLCREIRSMVVVSPIVALASAVIACIVAHRLDLPPGQATVALLCLVVAVTWGYRQLRTHRRS